MSNSFRSITPPPVADSQAGFSLLEIMVGVAIVATLGLIGILGYQKYIEKARGSDLVVKYDALRSTFNADTGQSSGIDCAELARRAGTARLADDHAKLDFGFEAVPGGGFRPVLTVCATVDKNGKLGISVARGAHETLSKNATVEKGAVVTDSVVSFALPLTDGNRALCTVAPASPVVACGGAAPAPAQAQPSYPGPAVCPPGADRLLVEDAKGLLQWACFDACPSGQVRRPGTLACKPVLAQAALALPALGVNTPSMTPQVASVGSPQLQPCAAGQIPDPADPGRCVARPSNTATPPSALPPTTTSGLGIATMNAPAQTYQQCAAACRASHPHGNSIAYRDCMQRCGR